MSDSTELYDRNIKKNYDLKIPSQKYYLLISQKEVKIELYEKFDDRIEYCSYDELNQEIHFRQLEFSIKLTDIYTPQILNLNQWTLPKRA